MTGSQQKNLLNMPKTCYSIFTSPNKNIPNYMNSIKLGDTTIQITATSKKSNNWLKTLIKIDKNQLYYAYIYSKIRYGIEVYGQVNDTQILKVQVQQKRTLKMLHNNDFKTPSRHKDFNRPFNGKRQ